MAIFFFRLLGSVDVLRVLKDFYDSDRPVAGWLLGRLSCQAA